MTPTASRTGIPADLIERVMTLSPEQQDELTDLIALADLPPTDPRTEEELMADLVRDAKAADSGRLPSMTPEQVQEYVRRELREKYGFEL